MRKNLHTIFIKDIKARCSCIFKALMKEHSGDVTEIRKHLPNVLLSTLKCYSGDCSMCRIHSMVCSGGVVKNWWYRSVFLGPNKITTLNINQNDKKLVHELLTMRLIKNNAAITKKGCKNSMKKYLLNCLANRD